ncbi:MAG: TIGR04283 family arsenosugar biosynthesis glycosyltransferase [Burkholderiales bacterium]
MTAQRTTAPDDNLRLGRLSIIVPALNEAGSIVSFLQSVREACNQPAEIIVADGGSDDATAALASTFCDRVVTSARGRAIQMNAGANVATGTILCFVHADSSLPPHADKHIRDALASGASKWGRFDVRLSGNAPALRIVERMMNWRSRLSGIATGDQAMFMTRTVFDKVGGYPDIALMEDVAMSRLLIAYSRPACLRQRLVTSSRRWEQQGILRTILLMWKLRLLYFLGADPARLAQSYYGRDI